MTLNEIRVRAKKLIQTEPEIFALNPSTLLRNPETGKIVHVDQICEHCGRIHSPEEGWWDPTYFQSVSFWDRVADHLRLVGIFYS